MSKMGYYRNRCKKVWRWQLKIALKGNVIKGKFMQNSQSKDFLFESFLMAICPVICLEGYPIQPFPSLEWHSRQVLVISSWGVHAYKCERALNDNQQMSNNKPETDAKARCMCCYMLDKCNVICHAVSNNAREKRDSSDSLSMVQITSVEVMHYSTELKIPSPGSVACPIKCLAELEKS